MKFILIDQYEQIKIKLIDLLKIHVLLELFFLFFLVQIIVNNDEFNNIYFVLR